jgi:2-polyprenyl-6-methoxyphenol hydroxylase-like FAD-dependent oxidoreductase
MAVEDALVLADSFAHAGLNESAWKLFEQRRRRKVDWTVSTSRRIGKLCYTGNRLFRFVRNLALRKTPDSVSPRLRDILLTAAKLRPRSSPT